MSDPYLRPEGYTVRAATKDDFDAVYAVISAADTADWGSPDFTESALRFEWNLPQLDMATDTWLIEPEGGEACAYGWLLARDEHRVLDGWTAVHPAHRGLGLGPWLLDLVEGRAAEHASEAADGADVRLHLGVVEPDRDGHALLEARGFAEVRHMWKMTAPLDAPLPDPSPPDGILIRGFEPGVDERTLYDVHVESFAGHWGWVRPTFEDWLASNMRAEDFDPTLCYLAVEAHGDVAVAELVGGVQGEEGWVYTVGVRPGWRGRGIAGAMLLTAFAELRRRGMPEAVLDVDSENATGAVGVYERVGMRPTRSYDFYERSLVGSGPSGVSAAPAWTPEPSASA